jgi:methionine-rich copper-binding protein CopC
MKTTILALTLGLCATGLLAHSPLGMTAPEDEAVLTEAPSEIVMDFVGDIRMTRVTLTDADGTDTKLDVSDYSGFGSDFTIPVEAMGSGTYVVEWRGLGTDGHPLTGKFSFTVE